MFSTFSSIYVFIHVHTCLDGGILRPACRWLLVIFYVCWYFSAAAQECWHGGKATDWLQWNFDTEMQGLPDAEARNPDGRWLSEYCSVRWISFQHWSVLSLQNLFFCSDDNQRFMFSSWIARAAVIDCWSVLIFWIPYKWLLYLRKSVDVEILKVKSDNIVDFLRKHENSWEHKFTL